MKNGANIFSYILLRVAAFVYGNILLVGTFYVNPDASEKASSQDNIEIPRPLYR